MIDNYPDGQRRVARRREPSEQARWGKRQVPFSRELLIEREDFMENAPSKFHPAEAGR